MFIETSNKTELSVVRGVVDTSNFASLGFEWDTLMRTPLLAEAMKSMIGSLGRGELGTISSHLMIESRRQTHVSLHRRKYNRVSYEPTRWVLRDG